MIDSHAHYTHPAYRNTFRYLTFGETGYTLQEGDLPGLLARQQAEGIACSVEPGVSLDGCGELLQLCERYEGQLFPAIGIHPTRSVFTKWSQRKKLADYAGRAGVVAIGETGLDYHFPRKEQHRLRQHIWFLYQLGLARKQKLPVIYHIRDAHRDALRVLRYHPARKLGGVIHCFNQNWDTAEKYLQLGFFIGIGGGLLQPEDRAGALWDAVAKIPLDRILLETDAPFILPYCKDVIPPKQLRRARNSSLILPAVVEKIARLKGCSIAEVEQATTENAIRLFRLPVKER